jgi:hypothetical protein
MNYCSIEDAWKNSDFINEQFKIYTNPHIKKNNIENFQPIISSPHISDIQCNDFLEHINTCKSCRMKMRNYFSSKIVEKIHEFTLDNKDTILLILICIFILILFNIIVSLFRK